MEVKQDHSLSLKVLYQYILERCFDKDEKQLIETFIFEHSLASEVEQIIGQVECIIENAGQQGNVNYEAVKTIAYKILKKFNTVLRNITDENEKNAIKSHLSKLAKCIIVEIHQKAPSYSTTIKESIQQGMQQAVLIEEYDRRDFENYLQLDYLDISKRKVSVVIESETKEYLTWNHKKANLKRLIHLLKNDYDCLKSQNDFSTLFDNPDNKTKIKWNGNKPDFLVLLFSLLYDKRYIEIKRGKGLWKIIKSRFVDFDKNSFGFDFPKKLNKLKTTPTPKGNTEKSLADIDKEIRIV